MILSPLLGVEVPEFPADPVGVSNSGEAAPSSLVGVLRGGGEGSSFGFPFGGGGALGGILHTSPKMGLHIKTDRKPVDVKKKSSTGLFTS